MLRVWVDKRFAENCSEYSHAKKNCASKVWRKTFILLMIRVLSLWENVLVVVRRCSRTSGLFFVFFEMQKTSEEIIKQMDAPSVAKLGNSDCWIVNHKCK